MLVYHVTIGGFLLSYNNISLFTLFYYLIMLVYLVSIGGFVIVVYNNAIYQQKD